MSESLNHIIYPGDCLLLQEHNKYWLESLIANIQETALCDLGYTKTEAKPAAQYTHTAMLVSPLVLGELYFPHARYRTLPELDPTTEVLVRRPIGSTPTQLFNATQSCLCDVMSDEPYSIRELLWYLWKLRVSKIFMQNTFANVFPPDGKHDVCSGRVIHWYHDADLLTGEIPEAWYPARIAIDTCYFKTIMHTNVGYLRKMLIGKVDKLCLTDRPTGEF